MATKIYDGHIVPLTRDEHYHNAIFLWKRNRKSSWEDLLTAPDLEERVKAILDAEKEKAEKSGVKIPKIEEVLKMDEFKEWAKTNEKYLDFVTRVQKAKSDPTVSDDEMKKLKAESAPLIKELAKEYKKVIAAA